MAAEDMFENSLAERADALVTSKKWMQPNKRLVLLRKFTIRLVVWSLCTRNFPSI